MEEYLANLYWGQVIQNFEKMGLSLVDTDATERVGGPSRLHTRCVESGPHHTFKTAMGAVETRCEDRRPMSKRRTSSGLHRCSCEATKSVSWLMDRSGETFIHAGEQILRRFNNAAVEFTRRDGFFVCRCG